MSFFEEAKRIVTPLPPAWARQENERIRHMTAKELQDYLKTLERRP